MKTSELTGATLDWAVAKCEGEETFVHKGQLETRWTENGWNPSTNWAQGGPIIEREYINITHPMGHNHDNDEWVASWKFGGFEEYRGPTPLIAAMRCYCCAKLGEFVDIPEELCPQENN